LSLTPPEEPNIMLSARPERRRIGPSFARRIITAVLMVMLAVMIVRDILARR